MNKRLSSFGKKILSVIRAVRNLKDEATGKNLSRLHRVESELLTVQGRKAPRRVKRGTFGGSKKTARQRATKSVNK